MKELALSASDLLAKAKSARHDVVDPQDLREIDVPENGTSFMIKKIMYVFMSGDLTEHDGVFSIRPGSIPASKAGRYRRAALGFRQKV